MADLEVYDALGEAVTKLKKELVNPALSHADRAVVFAMLQGIMEAWYKEYIAHQREILKREEPQ